jgi:glycosyltransferase involved in cell wall biosynthesis
VQLDQVVSDQLEANQVGIKIIRNPVNIGGGANILRCFENVCTKWFLLCGDDDVIVSEKFDEIREILVLNDDVAFIKLSSRFHSYNDMIKGSGISDFLAMSGDFNSTLFMSTYVFNRELCMEQLRIAYMMTGAFAPQFSIALLSCRKHSYLLSPISLTIANTGDPSWSPIDVMLCFYYLTDTPLTAKERYDLTKKIYRSHNVGRELLDIVAIYNSKGMRDEADFLRRKAMRIHMFFGFGFKRILALFGIILSPVLGQLSLAILKRAYRKLSGRDYSRNFIARHTGL